ncbi:MAG: hypothetical protein CM1200mP29_14530 [Verrucomicrobiota bacterium]|nr:MAG: hypothetical protein CM1200mP29_14530 [Verrucomicrobiota bacterium]
MANGPSRSRSRSRTDHYSSSTTLPVDEPDYDAGLIFLLSEAARLTGQLRREGLQARELFVRFGSVILSGPAVGIGSSIRSFATLSSTRSWSNFTGTLCRRSQGDPSNLPRLLRSAATRHPADSVGQTDAERWGAIDHALQVLERRFGENAIMTGAQFALKKQNDFFDVPPAKCPFGPREATLTEPVKLNPKEAKRYLKTLAKH